MPCHGIDGAFGHHEVQVGFYAIKATEPGEIRSKPGKGRGVLIADCAKNEPLAAYGVRNPSASDTPAPRPAVMRDGEPWIYLYRRAGSLTGWFPRRLTVPDAREHKNWKTGERSYADGPASQDFEVGPQKCRAKKPSGCGKLSAAKPMVRVKTETTHVRYSPRGTSVHYAHEGDEFQVLIANGPQGFHFGVCTKAAADGSLKKDMRGWFLAASVERV